MDNTGGIVGLNVGGTKFATSKETLLMAGTDTFFAGLLNSKYSSQKDSEGNFFIDRDPKTFEVILTFLRTGSLFYPPGISQKQVELECEFFGITISSEALRKAIVQVDSENKVNDEYLQQKSEAWHTAQAEEIARQNREKWTHIANKCIEQWKNNVTERGGPLRYSIPMPDGHVLNAVYKYTRDTSSSAHFALSYANAFERWMIDNYQLTVKVEATYGPHVMHILWVPPKSS